MRAFAAFMLLIVTLLLIPTAGRAQQPQPTPAPTAEQPSVVAPGLFESSTTALSADDFDRSILDMSLFLLLNPTYSQGYYVRALGYIGRQDIESALLDLDQALTTAPDIPAYQAALYAARAGIRVQEEDLADAIENYARAIALSPSAELYANRALVYITLQDFENAVTDLTSAIGGAGDNPLLRLYRAYAYTQLENDADAALDYYEFLQLIETRRVKNPPLVDGEPSVFSITQGVVHEFEFEGERGQVITMLAQARPGDSIDPLLVLLDDEGNVLAANDDSDGTTNAAIRNFELPSDGTYTVLVTHSLGGFDGQVAVVYHVAN